jgi:hypothetical protein
MWFFFAIFLNSQNVVCAVGRQRLRFLFLSPPCLFVQSLRPIASSFVSRIRLVLSSPLSPTMASSELSPAAPSLPADFPPLPADSTLMPADSPPLPADPPLLPADSPPSPHQQFRIKLYKLDPQGQWDDVGTGNLTARFTNSSLLLTARTDETNVILIDHRVGPQTEYDRQGETILTWSEPETEYAISFLEVDGCLQVWERVMYAQGKTEDELLAGSETLDQEVYICDEVAGCCPLLFLLSPSTFSSVLVVLHLGNMSGLS